MSETDDWINDFTTVCVSRSDIELLIDGLCALEELDTSYRARQIEALKAKLQGELRP